MNDAHVHEMQVQMWKPNTWGVTSLQSQKRSLGSVANAPKVDQQKRKIPFSGSVTTLMKEKFTTHISKEECVSFFNLCASLPSFFLSPNSKGKHRINMLQQEMKKYLLLLIILKKRRDDEMIVP